MIRFGPGGIPLSTTDVKIDGKKLPLRESAIYRLEELNLQHMEVEFVYGVRIKKEDAIELGRLAEEKDISLTTHGPYYINLASLEQEKQEASIERVYKTLWAGQLMKAKSVTFHPAFYQGRTPELIRPIILEGIIKAIEKVGDIENAPLLSIETTGKPSQWGEINEIVSLAAEVNNKLKRTSVGVCLDFAHLQARTNGRINGYEDSIELLNIIEKVLGRRALDSLHMHISGINYNEKGERNHLILEKSELKYKEIIQAIIDKEVSGWLVCESPNLEEDARLLKETYKKLGGK
ncbi:MAG: TIM barrel protein [bacterium]